PAWGSCWLEPGAAGLRRHDARCCHGEGKQTMKRKRTGDPHDLRTVMRYLLMPALAGTMLLSGCGGGSNVRRHAPPPRATPQPPATPHSERAQPAAKPTAPKTTNSLLALTRNVGTRTHADGYTGKGQYIAIMDNCCVPL